MKQEYRDVFALSEDDRSKKIFEYSGDINTQSFKDFEFDLVLNLNDLFGRPVRQPSTYVAAIKEMARIGKEVRIFPLLDEKGEIAAILGPVLLALQQENYGIEVKEVSSKHYQQGNAMLVVRANTCQL